MSGIYIAPADLAAYDTKLNAQALPMTGGEPDLVITSISLDPQQPLESNQVTFKAVIENKGGVATPANTQHDVVFQIDGTTVAWANAFTGPLEPGASVTVTANGGPQGVAYWQATAGPHQLTVTIDNRNIIAESDETNNDLNQSINVNTPTPQTTTTDTTAPSAPTNLRITGSDRHNASLAWSVTTDNVGVAGYYIYRNGSSDPIAFTTVASYTDKTLTPNKTYTYYVTAIDAAYNESTASNKVSASTRK
jgi:subtilase family serine protease